MKVLLFGMLTEVIGANRIEIENCSNVDTLKIKLMNNFPLLEKYKFTLAVNNQIITESIELNEHDTIALLPPFAGG